MQWAIGSAGSVWLVSIVLQMLEILLCLVSILPSSSSYNSWIMWQYLLYYLISTLSSVSMCWPSVITTVMIGTDIVSKVQIQFCQKTFSVDKGWCWNAILVQFNPIGRHRCVRLQFEAKHCQVHSWYQMLTIFDKYTETNTDTKHKYTIGGQVHHWYKMLAVTNCWPHVVSRPLTWCGLWPLSPLSSHPMLNDERRARDLPDKMSTCACLQFITT